MKLNRFETALMNNPARALLQWTYEAPLLARLGGRAAGLHVLEIGCGRGVGTQIILERFGAARALAFDLDPAMAGQARRRLAGYPPGKVGIAIGDAASIATPDAVFDAVFDFGILHHVPRWQRAVAEVRRVLRPGGRFFFEEVTSQALDRWFYRTFLDHPRENRFSAAELLAELERQGFRVPGPLARPFFGDFVVGVAGIPATSGSAAGMPGIG
jgi:ubiquinone/menaquinone biosynthesis C-methylase UbiE